VSRVLDLASCLGPFAVQPSSHGVPFHVRCRAVLLLVTYHLCRHDLFHTDLWSLLFLSLLSFSRVGSVIHVAFAAVFPRGTRSTLARFAGRHVCPCVCPMLRFHFEFPESCVSGSMFGVFDAVVLRDLMTSVKCLFCLKKALPIIIFTLSCSLVPIHFPCNRNVDFAPSLLPRVDDVLSVRQMHRYTKRFRHN